MHRNVKPRRNNLHKKLGQIGWLYRRDCTQDEKSEFRTLILLFNFPTRHRVIEIWERWSNRVLWKWNCMSHLRIRREFNELINTESLSSVLNKVSRCLNLNWKRVLANIKTVCSIYDIVIQLRDGKGNVIWLRADQIVFITQIPVFCFEIYGEQHFLIMSVD